MINVNISEIEKFIIETMEKANKLGTGFRHYQWREDIMAEKLGHIRFPKTDKGKVPDAIDGNGTCVEYKTGKTSIEKWNNAKKNNSFEVKMIFNGAYKEELVIPYLNQKCYFGLFDEATEKCLMLYEANSSEVVKQLNENNSERVSGKTTNLNTVIFTISLDDKNVVYLV